VAGRQVWHRLLQGVQTYSKKRTFQKILFEFKWLIKILSACHSEFISESQYLKNLLFKILKQVQDDKE